MTYATEGQKYDAMAWRRQITAVKAYSHSQQTIGGVQCKIYQDDADPGKDAKLAGIKSGLKRVVDAGFDFPDGIDFYTSNAGGYQSVAYHRDLSAGPDGTGRKTVVLLGAGAVDTAGMVGAQGVANAVASHNSSDYCAAVVVHELGHNLHERLAADFFWTPDANTAPNVGLAMDVSQYATRNKKEVVAEVFTGMLYGITYKPGVLAMYDEYSGFYPPALERGRRRR